MEKSLWVQRAHMYNFLYKNLNTRYFQMVLKVGCAKRTVHQIKNGNNEWISGSSNISNVVFRHFDNFFKSMIDRPHSPFDVPLPSHFFKDMDHLKAMLPEPDRTSRFNREPGNSPVRSLAVNQCPI